MADVIEVEVFNKLFTSIAEEMGIVLARSSFSPNIKERRDFSCALFDRHGELVAQAAHIPVHLGAMPLTLDHVLKSHRFQPGDVCIVNDPFQGGSHLPDITVIEAVFAGGEDAPAFYVMNRAHHADVGGQAPGSMGLATSIDQEGVLISPTWLLCGGIEQREFLDSFLSRVRNPVERRGDLRAQLASLRRGRTRLEEMLSRHGLARLQEYIDELKGYAEILMRKVVGSIPDGVYSFTDYLDSDGFGSPPLAIHLTLTIEGDMAEADFRQTCDQVLAPLNTVPSVAVSATTYVFQCLLGEGYPINHGSYRPLAVRTRPGSLLHAGKPAPVAAGNVETSQRIVDTLLGALAQAVPLQIPAASCGSMNNVAIGGFDSGHGCDYSYYETIGGGMGARPQRAGLDGVHNHMTNTMNTPVEALEHAYPLRIEHYGLWRDSGGAGRHRGGAGIRRTYRFLENARVSLLTERRRTRPYGLGGGGGGGRGQNRLRRKGGKTVLLAGKVQFDAGPDDVLEIRTPGGGGWGPPGER